MVEMGTFSKVGDMRDWLKSLPRNVCFDYAGSDLVFIAGSGRSGTSWLANICNYKNSFRYLFEPLNPRAMVMGDEFRWCLMPNEKSLLLDKVITGKVSNSWVNSRNQRMFARRRLIKEIRSNLMLTWLHTHYPLTKLVLILRNPLDVAASKKKLASLNDGSRWLWEPCLATLLAESQLQKQLTAYEYEVLSEQIGQGVVMESIADWCINNLVAMRAIETSTIHVIYYERLLSNPSRELPNLMTYIGVDMDDSLLTKVHQPSETTRKPSGLNQGDDLSSQLMTWDKSLTPEEQKRATKLLSIFGIERFYSDRWEPVIGSSPAVE